MKITSSQLRKLTTGAAMVLGLTLASSGFSITADVSSIDCTANPVGTVLDSQTLGALPGTVDLQCLLSLTPGVSAQTSTNLTLTLNTNIVNNRDFSTLDGNSGPLPAAVGRSSVTDAIIVINDNVTGGPFATPNYTTGPTGQSPQYGILQSNNTLLWPGIILPVAPAFGNSGAVIRITNIRAKLPPEGSISGTIQMTPGTLGTSFTAISPIRFTARLSYTPDARFINRLYGQSSFDTFTPSHTTSPSEVSATWKLNWQPRLSYSWLIRDMDTATVGTPALSLQSPLLYGNPYGGAVSQPPLEYPRGNYNFGSPLGGVDIYQRPQPTAPGMLWEIPSRQTPTWDTLPGITPWGVPPGGYPWEIPAKKPSDKPQKSQKDHPWEIPPK
jgi:hypothetical protein